MLKLVYCGNFDRLSVGEPEIAQALEKEGVAVTRLDERTATIQEVEAACDGADALLVAKFRVGTPREREELMARLKCPTITFVFDLYVGL